MDFSFRSSVAHTHAWSLLSGLSLADVSVLSVIALPLDLEDVANRHHYIDAGDQQLASMADDFSSAHQLESPFTEEKSIYHLCLRIYSQLIQITGFQGLFDTQWRGQQVTYNKDMTEQCEGHRNWFWQQVDIFAALKGVFREDMAYQLLADSLSQYLGKDVCSDFNTLYSHTTTDKPISMFFTLYNKIGLRTCHIFHSGDALRDDNVSFLKVLACISKVLDLLASNGSICLLGGGDLDALVSSARRSSVLPSSAYKHALADFVDAQWLFVRDLLCLINMLKKLAPVLGEDHPQTSRVIFSSHANLEIELLLTAEKMLLAPSHLHLWAVAVRRWSIAVETYYRSTIVQEQEVRRSLLLILEEQRSAPTRSLPSKLSMQGHLELVTSCLELLSRPSQMIPHTIRFFEYILPTLLGDPALSEPISPVQRQDIAEGQQILKHTLNMAKEESKQKNLNQALKSLELHAEHWNWNRTGTEEFGRLVEASSLSIRTNYSRATSFHVYLFENVLLCLVEPWPVGEGRWRSSELARAIDADDSSRKSSKLELRGKIYLSSIERISYVNTQDSQAIEPYIYEADSDDQAHQDNVEGARNANDMAQLESPLSVSPSFQSSGSSSKITSPSGNSLGPLTPPPRLQDRPLLFSPR
ncbi:hypothetical protein NPX13_g9983 [Xylaria arbuscula]|uniref:Uncharacterized protein n=1 Tax=Xylaria arbuscula TaxID=114810 RepID=A0A9W8N5P7_9PEZI|nr:hypothetical protein NPX13_g9983 [Xylaria arbuscula]